jgi:hypothetical protein
MWGLFTELGPFFVGLDETSLDKNPYSWHKNHSIIFIDNPVGTGRLMNLHKFIINKFGVQWGLGSRTPLFTHNSVHEQIFRATNVSDDDRFLGLRTHKLATAAS